MSSTADTESRASTPGRSVDLWSLFASMWAAAALLHLIGNRNLAPDWGKGLLAATALLVLVRPRVAWFSLPLGGAVLANVWLEAPVLGNHWLLHGFVAVIVVGGVLSARGDAAVAIARVVGPLRLTLLAFYGFAAFAKLNTDFFDPAVSCATFYLGETAESWSLGSVADVPEFVDRLVTVAVAGVELSIPILLVWRRTRDLGVLVALGFHFVLALDRTHQFFDFSSVLAALFVLFLDPETIERATGRARAVVERARGRWAIGPTVVGALVILVIASVSAAAVVPQDWGDWATPSGLRRMGVVIWIGYGSATIAAVALAVRRHPGRRHRDLVGEHTPRWLLILPVLAVLNGLTPYVEIKSGTSWNMYSNLLVADGSSNHLLIRRGVPMTDAHESLIEITASDDPALDFYVGSRWRLPEVMLRDHLADRPGVRVTGERDGRPVTFVGGEPAGRPEWRQKFQVFRAVDPDGPVSCQPSFGPAR